MSSGLDRSLPKVVAVSPARSPLTLNVRWADGTASRVDLTGLVHSSRHFRVFADDSKAFRKVRPTEFGGGIEWDNGLDYSADTLRMLADEQQPAGGDQLVDFESRFGLNTAETAALLDVAERTIRAYRQASTLPQPVAIALRRMQRDPTVLAAHYRPIPRRSPGRPRRDATDNR